MIVMQPVLKVVPPEGPAPWPLAAREPFSFLPLHGRMTTEEIGLAVLCIAVANEGGSSDGPAPSDDRPPADHAVSSRSEALLRGLLTAEYLSTPGGFQVTDTGSGAVLKPGCCNGIEEWRDWLPVLDGEPVRFGHGPDPEAELVEDTVRLTVDLGREDSPVIELSPAELHRLLAGAERDLRDFLAAATAWAVEHLPARLSTPFGAALARALDRELDLARDLEREEREREAREQEARERETRDREERERERAGEAATPDRERAGDRAAVPSQESARDRGPGGWPSSGAEESCPAS